MGVVKIIILTLFFMIAVVSVVSLTFSMIRCMTIKLSKYFPIKLDDELLALKVSAEQKKNSRIPLLDTVFVDFWKKHNGYSIFFALVIFYSFMLGYVNCLSENHIPLSYSCYPDVMTLQQKLSVIELNLIDFTAGTKIFIYFSIILKIIGMFSFNGRNIIGRGFVEILIFVIFIKYFSLFCVTYCNNITSRLIVLRAEIYYFILIMGTTVVWWIFVKLVKCLKPILYRWGIKNPLDVIILGLSTVPFIWLYYFTMELLK